MASEYWQISLGEALGDIGIDATEEQVKQLAEACAGIAGTEVDYTGVSRIPNPDRAEIARLQSALRREREKVACQPCRGTGSITEQFGPVGRTSISQCDRCGGEGKHAP